MHASDRKGNLILPIALNSGDSEDFPCMNPERNTVYDFAAIFIHTDQVFTFQDCLFGN